MLNTLDPAGAESPSVYIQVHLEIGDLRMESGLTRHQIISIVVNQLFN